MPDVRGGHGEQGVTEEGAVNARERFRLFQAFYDLPPAEQTVRIGECFCRRIICETADGKMWDWGMGIASHTHPHVCRHKTLPLPTEGRKPGVLTAPLPRERS